MTKDELWKKTFKYLQNNHNVMSLADFIQKTNIKINIKTLSKVFNGWVNEGKLTKKNGYYYLVIKEDKPVEEKKKVIVKAIVPQKKKIDHISTIVKILSFMISIILILVSIHFTYEFNKLSLPKFWAFLLSISVVLFMSFAFVVKNMTESNIKKTVVILLWILGISYSVFTAVSGQFNDQRKYIAEDTYSKDNEELKIINEELKELKNKQKDLQYWKKLEIQYTDNPELKEENPQTWNSIKRNVSQLVTTEDQIRRLNDRKITIIRNQNVKDENVFGWIQNILHINKNTIQFIIILFQSLFIDLCSTILMDFVFEKEKKK